jgi:Uma2 family endonuclease
MGEPAKPLQGVYEQFLATPSHLVAEIIRGALVTQPRPTPRHARAASVLGIRLGGPFDLGEGGPGGWIILDEPEVHLGEHVLVPDLAGWRRERMPALPDTAYFELAPDWVCEVLSPGTQAIDRADKMPIYAEHGVQHAWLVDPAAQLLEVYRLESSRWLRLGTWRGDARVRAEPFDAIELALDRLWKP